VWLHKYVSGAGFIAFAVEFGPFCLAVKVFLMLDLACAAAFSALLAALIKNAAGASALRRSVNKANGLAYRLAAKLRPFCKCRTWAQILT
jgi:hypothetical protein